MPKIKEKRFEDMRAFTNVYEWTDYNSACPFRSGKWNEEIFYNPNPIVLELACGKGEYSLGMGKLYPDKNFVGVDIKGNRMWVGASEALSNNYGNVRYLRAYIDHLHQFFTVNEVSELWVIFPDPYLKKARKRLTSPKFLELYRKFLKPGGTINLKTDSVELYEYTKEVIESEQLQLLKDIPDVYAECPEDPVLSIRTYYEDMHLSEGKTIRFLSFVLR